MFSIIAALALAVSAPLPANNVHTIFCTQNGSDNEWQGTGWFIRGGVMATALHVVNDMDKCKDGTTGETIAPYKTDSHHDLALVSGSHGDSVIKYSCNRPKIGKIYTSYGYSSDFPAGDFYNPLALEFNLVATKTREILVPGIWNFYPMREYKGYILHGMSGGPVVGDDAVAIALNNAGDEVSTILYDLADTALCTNEWDT